MNSGKLSNGLEWTAHPLRELGRLAGPITVSMLSYAVMTLMDTLFVGWLGPAELAGVGLGGTASFALLCFSFGLLRGAKTLRWPLRALSSSLRASPRPPSYWPSPCCGCRELNATLRSPAVMPRRSLANDFFFVFSCTHRIKRIDNSLH